jgi:uncharacterized protein YkwD
MIKLTEGNNRVPLAQAPYQSGRSSKLAATPSAWSGFGWIEITLALFFALLGWLVFFVPAQATTPQIAPAISESGPTTFAPPQAIYLPMAVNGDAAFTPGDIENDLPANPTPIPTTPTPEPTPEPTPDSTPALAPTSEPTPESTPEPAVEAQGCQLSPEEAAVAQLMADHPEQKRAQTVCHPVLAQVARARAADMAQRRYFGHVNPDGYGPNYLVTQAGYDLPGWYASAHDANNIESIGAGYTSAQSVWEAWLSSSGHRRHVLAAENGEPVAFYADQEAYGIGFWHEPGSEYGRYWVFISAPLPGE